LPAEQLLPPGTRCGSCSGEQFEKEMDILDVWFDSGVSQAAVLQRRDYLRFPAELYLEGSDQHRGWFHSSLLAAVGARDMAPYRIVLTHGFVVDGQGYKMSKSLGNVIAPEEIIQKYGAEILRLWVAAEDYRDDIRISPDILKRLSEAYRRIRNTCRFLLGNLADFDPARDALPLNQLDELDRFALHTLQDLIREIRKAYDRFEFHRVYHALQNYCVVDLSSFYLDILKDRLYTSGAGSPARRSAQTALHQILTVLLRLMSPILSFTAEEGWWHLHPGTSDQDSVHLGSFPEEDASLRDEALNVRWRTILALRSDVSRALEMARQAKVIGHSLDARVTLALPPQLRSSLANQQGLLSTVFIVSQVAYANPEEMGNPVDGVELEGLKIQVDLGSGVKCERCWVRDETVGSFTEHPAICERCHEVVTHEG
jgi:isoleucyl-tRNA synthetase